mmetsp:Transcript_13597/g.39197  ORF Transcript_13597/g.39197 Transcript_13597/m.39197 type:complete len:100 (+) Transcript_13597:80-379(+)
MQFIPLIVYLLSQQFCKEDGPVAQYLPKQLLSWLPIGLALAAFVISSQREKARASEAAGKLVGEPAPPFDFTLGEKKMSIAKFVIDNPRPTIVDFYQNF